MHSECVWKFVFLYSAKKEKQRLKLVSLKVNPLIREVEKIEYTQVRIRVHSLKMYAVPWS